MHLTQHYQVFPDARPDARSRHTFRVTEEKGMGALQGCVALSAPAWPRWASPSSQGGVCCPEGPFSLFTPVRLA